MNQIHYSFLLVILHVASISTSPMISDIATTRRATRLTGSEPSNLAMTVTTVNETILAIEEMNVTEPSSKFESGLESSQRLERNIESSEILDDNKSVPTTDGEFNFTTIPWDNTSSVNVTEIRAFMDHKMMEEVTAVQRQELTLEQLSSMLSSTASTIQLPTGIRGEAKSGAIYEKTDGVWKKCQLHTDCYELREPKAWSDLKSGGSWTNEGCFCDDTIGSCIIELRKDNQMYYTDCISEF